MKITQEKFDDILGDTIMQPTLTIAEVAQRNDVTERMVKMVKDAGIFDRWPYVVAKAKYGYRTPEYKTYLKRQKLPLTPPPIPSLSFAVSITNTKPLKAIPVPVRKPSLWDRLLGRAK